MSRKYSPEQKAEALTRLFQNSGNSVLTAVETGIPERTLRAWRQTAWAATQLGQVGLPAAAAAALPLRQPPTPTPHLRQPHNDLLALEGMRHQILDALLSSSNDWPNIFAFMPPYQKAQVAVMLLDRLMKLDEHLKPYRPKSTVKLQLNDSEGEEPGGEPKPHLTQSAPSSEGDSQQ